jgi:hypothetical protein
MLFPKQIFEKYLKIVEDSNSFNLKNIYIKYIALVNDNFRY